MVRQLSLPYQLGSPSSLGPPAQQGPPPPRTASPILRAITPRLLRSPLGQYRPIIDDFEGQRGYGQEPSEDGLSIVRRENLRHFPPPSSRYAPPSNNFLAGTEVGRSMTVYPTGNGYSSQASPWNWRGLDHPPAWRIARQEQEPSHMKFAFDEGLPFSHVKPLGKGSAAVVDAISFGPYSQLYARKLVTFRPGQTNYVDAVINEVNIMRRLPHIHIISISTTYEQESAKGCIGSFGIIMNPVADCDLDQFLAENPTLTNTLEPKLKRWCVCLMSALAYIHERGVRHKDIKPRNIVVRGDQIFFTDFGIARLFAGQDTTETESHTLKTPVILFPSLGCARGLTRKQQYCAPEVAGAKRRGHAAADMFSLGCVLSRIVTILCGETVSDFDNYRTNGESSAYYLNTDKTLRWLLFLLARLDSKCGRFTGSLFPNSPHITRPPHDHPLADQYTLLDWCFETLQPNPYNRTPANTLQMRSNSLDASLVCECRTPRYHWYPEMHPKCVLRIPNIDELDVFDDAFPVSWDSFNRLYGVGQVIART
ncbi:MAG: hypothetical protein M1839_005999 [Geoglossum umbratile]|nr:MAG: hypothetical protein M1839_005999 [Geoglossum umbratile]